MKYYIDIFAREPKLFINQEKTLKSTPGFIMSLFMIISILIISFYFLIDLFSFRKSNIMYNKLDNPTPKLNMTEVPFIIGILDGSFNSYPEADRLFKVYALKAGTNSFKMTVEKCDINKHFGIYKNHFINTPNITNYYCIPYAQRELIITNSNFLNFDVKRCINGTTIDLYSQKQISNDCVSEELFTKTMTSSNIRFFSVDSIIDHRNRTQPNQIAVKSFQLPISSTIFKRYWVYKKLVIYNTDYGFAMQDEKIENFYQHDFIDTSVDLRKDAFGKFAQVSIYVSNNYDVYFRTYTKIQNVFAEISGVFQALFLISKLIVSFLTNNIYFLTLDNFVNFQGESARKSFIEHPQQIIVQSDFLKLKSKSDIVNEANFNNSSIHPLKKLSSFANKKLIPSSDITKESEKRHIKLSCKDYLSPFRFLKKGSDLENLIEKYKKSMSIDFILRKINSYDIFFFTHELTEKANLGLNIENIEKNENDQNAENNNSNALRLVTNPIPKK
jgi:hypothetical protein